MDHLRDLADKARLLYQDRLRPELSAFYRGYPRLTKGLALAGVGFGAVYIGGIVAQAAVIGGASIIGGAYLLHRIPRDYSIPLDAVGFRLAGCKALKVASRTRAWLTDSTTGHLVLDAGAMGLTGLVVGVTTITGVAVVMLTGLMTSLAIDVFCGGRIVHQEVIEALEV